MQDVSTDPIWQSLEIPSCSDVQHLVDSVKDAIQKHQLQVRAERVRIWKERFADDWDKGGRSVYEWCKGEDCERADMICRPDGSLTCNPKEMDALVRDAWLPVFQMYKHADKPSWSDFSERFGQHIPPRHDMSLGPLTGSQLRETIVRMRSSSAPGCDSWRVEELKRLPLPLLERLAFLLSTVEETGI